VLSGDCTPRAPVIRRDLHGGCGSVAEDGDSGCKERLVVEKAVCKHWELHIRRGLREVPEERVSSGRQIAAVRLDFRCNLGGDERARMTREVLGCRFIKHRAKALELGLPRRIHILCLSAKRQDLRNRQALQSVIRDARFRFLRTATGQEGQLRALREEAFLGNHLAVQMRTLPAAEVLRRHHANAGDTRVLLI
jgi:hypothetical protein